MSEMMDAAQAYAALGWRVLPVYSIVRGRCMCGKTSCSAPGKHPRINKWQERATTDPAQIEAWWKTMGLSNVGVATGAKSGIVVVDVDPRHGGEASLVRLNLPETYAVQTGGGGRHLYYQHPGGEIPNSAGRIGLGIDIRGDGGFVVAPPSNHASGNAYEVLLDLPLAPFPADLLTPAVLSSASTRAAARAEGGRDEAEGDAEGSVIVQQGARNDFLASQAGKLRHLGLQGDELVERLLEINAAQCDPPLGDDEVHGIAASIGRYARSHPLTDLGNSERFADEHGDLVRYCDQQKSWYVWDGKRWRRDVVQKVKRLATRTVRGIYAEAAGASSKEARESIADHAKASESSGRISAMVRLAQVLPDVAIRADVLDTDPWLLNVLDGTLELRTGTLGPHDPRHLITKLAPVGFDPHASSELWDGFVRDVTGGDVELACYLQRAAGYSLTGKPTEHAVFFLHGPPATGKSKFTGALKDVLGDYAVQTAFETFLAKRFGGGASNDIADLAGARLVLATEADRGRRFAEATLKQLTGGDTVRARQLYQSNFEFKPQFTLWLAANDAPQVNNEDDAIFRRMNIIPFTQVVPVEKQDKDLGDKLAAPTVRAAILAWAVEGCLAWQDGGLRVPKIVVDATAQYREEQDPLEFFLDECCVVELDCVVLKAKLQQVYVVWAKASGVRSGLSPREFSRRIARLPGVVSGRASGRRTDLEGDHRARGLAEGDPAVKDAAAASDTSDGKWLGRWNFFDIGSTWGKFVQVPSLPSLPSLGFQSARGKAASPARQRVEDRDEGEVTS
jgi:putative DNA primase/helicase